MFVEKRIEGEYGRSCIEGMSEEDRRYKINSRGALALKNAYGELVFINEESGTTSPVICGHGGSMWLCRKCKDGILEDQRLKNET